MYCEQDPFFMFDSSTVTYMKDLKLRNLWLNNKEMNEKKIVLSSFPYYYIIDINTTCNLKCEMCLSGIFKNFIEKPKAEYEEKKDIKKFKIV